MAARRRRQSYQERPKAEGLPGDGASAVRGKFVNHSDLIKVLGSLGTLLLSRAQCALRAAGGNSRIVREAGREKKGQSCTRRLGSCLNVVANCSTYAAEIGTAFHKTLCL